MTATFVPEPPAGPPPPPPPPPPPSATPARRSPRGRAANAIVLVALVVFGVAIDLAVQSPLAGWAIAGAVAVLAFALIASGEIDSPSARAMAVGAVVPASLAVIRSSPWVVAPAVAASVTLLVLATSLPERASLWQRRFVDLWVQLVSLCIALVLAPVRVAEAIGVLLPTSGERRQRVTTVVRGLALAVPIAIVVGALLAAADGVFASLVTVEVDVAGVTMHAGVITCACWMGAALFAQVRRLPPPGVGERAITLGAVESAMVLAGLAAVYAVFAGAQVLVTLKGDAYVQETTGLTYAEYAREGFFPLLGAAAITAVVLLALRGVTDLSTTARRNTFRALGLVTVALTLLLVHTAVVRLDRYDEAYGATMLRLSSTTFAWWTAIVFVLIAGALVWPRVRADWLAGAVLCSLVGVVVVFGLADPERQVVERNVTLAIDTGRFDADYLARLSPDAIPPLVGELDRLPDHHAAAASRVLCRRSRPEPWTPPERQAAEVLRELCGR